MRRNEDDRRNVARLPQPPLQFQARHAPQMEVEHQAVWWRERRGRREEGLGRRVGADVKSRPTQQSAERAAKTLVLIHHHDIGFGLSHADPIRSGNSAGTITKSEASGLLSFGAMSLR